jgi:hypothetical protein
VSDASERDRILARVRTTTAVAGIGAVLVGGALAGWLRHEATQSASDTGAGSSADTGSSSGATDDDGLSGSSTPPESGSSDSGQPGITSGGS